MSAVVVHNAIASLVQAYAEIVGEQDARIKELQEALLRARLEADEARRQLLAERTLHPLPVDAMRKE